MIDNCLLGRQMKEIFTQKRVHERNNQPAAGLTSSLLAHPRTYTQTHTFTQTHLESVPSQT